MRDPDLWIDILDALEGRKSPSERLRQRLAEAGPEDSLTRSAATLLDALDLAAHQPSGALVRSTVEAIQRGPLDDIGGKARRVWAALKSDSLRPVAGIRSGRPTRDRHLVYESDHFTVSISIQPAPTDVEERIAVRGSVMPKEATALPLGHVRVREEEGQSHSIEGDGSFLFKELARGVISLEFEVGSDSFLVGPLPDLES